MKKVIIPFVMSFLFFISAYAYSYEIVWENTYVDVVLNDDIENYKEIPTAKLYVDGVLVDTFVGYNRYANDTTIDTVSTSVVGEYYVYYEAIFSEYKTSCIERITFNVYDPSIPYFNIPKDIYINYGDTFDLDSVICFDDLEGNLEYTYKGKINYNLLGDYVVNFYANDSNNNFINYEVTFHIVDEEKPIINVINNIIYIDEDHDFNNDVVITDNYSNMDNKAIFIHEIDFNVLGEYDVIIYAKDSNDNYSYVKEKFYLKDRIPPEIKLKTDIIKVKLNEKIEYSDYVLSVYDNYSKMEKENIIIETNYKNEVGNYYVEYKAYDESHNEGINRLNIKVLDDEFPLIEANNKVININSVFDPYKEVYAYDNLDLDISYRLNYEGFVNTYKEGIYEITYNVYDSSGNYTYKTIYVNVVNDKKNNTLSFPEYIEETYEEKEEIKEMAENYKFNYYTLIIPIIIIVIVIVVLIIRRRKK